MKETLKKLEILNYKFKNSAHPNDAEAALREMFLLIEQCNLNYTTCDILASNRYENYHSIIIYEILPLFYDDSSFIDYVELEYFESNNEAKIKFIFAHECINTNTIIKSESICITFINSYKIDNLYVLQDDISKENGNNKAAPIKINVPDLQLFIQRLDGYISSFSKGVKIIK